MLSEVRNLGSVGLFDEVVAQLDGEDVRLLVVAVTVRCETEQRAVNVFDNMTIEQADYLLPKAEEDE